MALGNINLDNRSFEQLFTVLKQHIPTQYWRDHNPSDPGIMLLELLAWLGEMSLYRMNRVPLGHREKFLKLIADSPQPATSLVNFTAILDPAVRPAPELVVLPSGTRLATDFNNGRRYVFETMELTVLTLPDDITLVDPLQEVSTEVNTREFVIADDQKIGISQGTAGQVFALRPPQKVVETPDHPPQMTRPTGFSLAVAGGGKLGPDSGITGVEFQEADLEKAHILSYDSLAGTLTIDRISGVSETIAVPPGAIAEGAAETVTFPSLNGLVVVLCDAFDKTSNIEVDASAVTITGGLGAINPATVDIVAATGLPQPRASTLLTLSRLATPATVVVSSTSGLSGVVDLSTGGAKTITLNDKWGRGFDLVFTVSTAFDGNEQSATINLPVLSNIFFLGTSEDVRHSPWSEVVLDSVYRTSEYDPNPQVRVAAGYSPGLASGGKVSAASGVEGISYPASSMEEAFLLRHLTGPSRLRLRSPGGPTETVALTPGAIPPGTTETISFSTFNIDVELNDQFDKTNPVTIDAASITVTSGTGVILPGSVRLIGTDGLAPPMESPVVTLSNFSNPAAVVVTMDRGFRGIVDLSTTGVKIARLRDIWDRRFDLRLQVQTAFDGSEESASIELHALENLFFLGTLWEARRSLLTETSQVTPGVAGERRHCQVDPFEQTLRFGDGVFGSIPPLDAKIVASYRVFQGAEALVREGELEFLLDPPPLFSSESISFSNLDGDGGSRFYSPETRTAEALTDLGRTHRLVTAEDFERVLLTDFNEFDVMAKAAPNVLSPEEIRSRRAAEPILRRAVAMMNRDAALEERRGHVAILVLAALDPALDPNLLHDESIPLPTKQVAIDLDASLQDRLLRFLDERRLITTRLNLTNPQLKAVGLTTFVIVDRGRNVTEMTERLRFALHDFFDIFTGYFDGEGWPLGRTVYQSEIYQLLEGLDGVDHVASLTLSPADPSHGVELAPAELPILQNLTLSVDKA